MTLPTGTDPAVERAARRTVPVSLINSPPNDPEAIQAWFDEVFSG
jgi:ABC-type sugar transport system substrate-binding protein